MKRWMIAAACSGALVLPPVVEAQDEWAEEVRGYLETAASTFAAQGYVMTQEPLLGSLDDGEDETVTIQLVRGQEYMIVGACDTDCEDLDMVLSGANGQIDEDMELDDFPIVDVVVDAGGSFTVEVQMADCSSEPCRYGLGVFARPVGGGSGRSSRSGNAPDITAVPSYGTVTLTAGFDPDPHVRSISAGGDDVVTLPGAECTGYINAAAPDLDLNYTTGDFKLYVYAKADTDITLIINQPDGSWVCSDDVDGTNPSIEFADSPTGNYNIWIGTFEPSQSPLPEATVYFSEMQPRW